MKDGKTLKVQSLQEANKDFIKRMKEKHQRVEQAKEMLNQSEETNP